MACSTREAALGVLTKLGFAVSNPGTPPANPTEQLERDSDTFGLNQVITDTSGIRGTRGRSDDRLVETSRIIRGGFRCRPTPLDLYAWLPRIMGGTYGVAVSNVKTIKLAETLPCFDVFRTITTTSTTEVFKYRECRVQSATISGSEGGVLGLDVEAIGRNRDAIGTNYTWPTDVLITTGKPWPFSSVVLSLPTGTTYRIFSFSLTINNMLEPRYANSATITDLPSVDRRITLGLNMPYGTSSALLTDFATAAKAVKLVGLYGADDTERSIQFECSKVRPLELNDPAVPGKGEIKWDVALEFFYDLTAETPETPDDQLIAKIKEQVSA